MGIKKALYIKQENVGKNRWGGDITIASTTDASGFIITYKNVPKIPCEQLLSASDKHEFHHVTAEKITCTDNSTMNFILN